MSLLLNRSSRVRKSLVSNARIRLTVLCLTVVTICLLSASNSHALNAHIARQVIASGGAITTGGNFVQFSTVGQSVVQTFHSTDRVILSGFWNSPAASACCLGSTGNIDCDPAGDVNIADLTTLVDYLFVSMAPLCCRAEANVQRDNVIDVCDLTTMVDYLFIDFKPLGPCRLN